MKIFLYVLALNFFICNSIFSNDFVFYMPIDDIQSLKQLLDEGVDVNATNKYGETMLHLAMKESDVEMVKMLLDYEAKTDVLDHDRLYPTDWAFYNKNKKIINLLVDYGVNYYALESRAMPSYVRFNKIETLTFSTKPQKIKKHILQRILNIFSTHN